jgi:hypothetical protein
MRPIQLVLACILSVTAGCAARPTGGLSYIDCVARDKGPMPVRLDPLDPASVFHVYPAGTSITRVAEPPPAPDVSGWRAMRVWISPDARTALGSAWIKAGPLACDTIGSGEVCRPVSRKRYEEFELHGRPDGELPVAMVPVDGLLVVRSRRTVAGVEWVEVGPTEVWSIRGWFEQSRLSCSRARPAKPG